MTTVELTTNLLSAVQADAALMDYFRDQLTEAQAQLAAAKIEAMSAHAQLAAMQAQAAAAQAQLADCRSSLTSNPPTASASPTNTTSNTASPATTDPATTEPATTELATSSPNSTTSTTPTVPGTTAPDTAASNATATQGTTSASPSSPDIALTISAQVVGDQIHLTASRPAQLIIRSTQKSAILADHSTTFIAGPAVPGWTYWAQAIDAADRSPELQIQVAGTAPKAQPYDQLWLITPSAPTNTATNSASTVSTTTATNTTTTTNSATNSAATSANISLDLDALPATYPQPANAIVPKQGDDLQSAADLARKTGRILFLYGLTISGKMLTLDGLKSAIIQRCTFRDIPGPLQIGHAIRILGGCPGLIITNCSFASTGAEAIIAWGDMSGVCITGNHFANLFEGIHFPNYTGSNLLIAQNTFTAIRRMAIELQGDGAMSTTVDDNTITYSDIASTYDGTFAISAVNRGTGTRVRNNTITGPSGNRTPGNWGVAIGIEFSGINGRCEGNKITGCNEGIHIVYAKGAEFTTNTLTSTGDMAFWQTGTEDASGAKITGNTLSNAASGILFTGPASRRQGLTIHSNTGTVRGDFIRGDSSGAVLGPNTIGRSSSS